MAWLDERKPVFWFTLATVVAVAALSAVITVSVLRPGDSPLRLEVDISERKLYVHHGGDVIRTYDIAVGTPSHPTPRGGFVISRVIWDPPWVPPDRPWAAGQPRRAPDDPANPMEAVKLIFKPPYYYIHGTNAPQTLGTAASHGCIRMSPASAESLAERVQEHGGAHRSPEWYEMVKRQDATTRAINLPNPVPLTIHG